VNDKKLPAERAEEQARPALTAKRLREILDYNRRTGEFIWRARKVLPRKLGWRARVFNGTIAGKRAGYVHKDGSVTINIDGRRHQAHRLAWLWVHGTLPDRGIEHKDGDRSNNAIDNLRLLPPAAQPKPKLGPPTNRWVFWDKPRGLWAVEVTVSGERRHQSLHADFGEAVAAGKVALEARAVA
jgi:hypothetical protein